MSAPGPDAPILPVNAPPEAPTLVQVDDSDETYYLNMGPQHPSMHGVLRLLLKLRGERILECDPVIGYAHRAHEKMAENRTWVQFYPNTSRIDYLSGMIYNIAYCQAMEKVCSIEVPERAVAIRIIACELNRIQSHLLWFGTYLMDIGGITPFLYCFDDREEILGILAEIDEAVAFALIKPFHNSLYVWAVLLQLSLALRIVFGLLMGLLMRKIFGIVNAVVILLFFVNLVILIFIQLRKKP